MNVLTRTGVVLVFAAIAVTACGRKDVAHAGPATYDEAMVQASRLWEINRWSEAFAACDAAFRLADRDGDAKAVRAVECAAEAAVRSGRPALAMAHYDRLVAAHAGALRTANGRQRLANNHGVLLIEQGRKAEGIERLTWALREFEGADYVTSGHGSFAIRAAIVKNLARAYYDTAGDPDVRAWVRDQGALLLDYMDPKVRGAQFAMGASAALHALVIIGRRQANTDTPAWEARIREWEPLEDEIAARHPDMARACELVPLRTTMMETCLREVRPAG